MTGPPLSLVIASYLAECERWRQSQGQPEEMRRREAAAFMCWLASQPVVRGERG